jgi:hypothetical protein
MNKIKNVDGFVWIIVTEKAKDIFNSGIFELYALYEDGSESLIDSIEDLNEAIEGGLDIAIEGGYMKAEALSFKHEDKDVNIVVYVEEPDYWTTIDGYDVHYCEDYNEICVYLAADYTKTIYSRPIKSN